MKNQDLDNLLKSYNEQTDNCKESLFTAYDDSNGGGCCQAWSDCCGSGNVASDCCFDTCCCLGC